jgi:membrane associated rhomboid family serine protease
VVIPIHDDNPVRRRPIVTYILIALNLAVFIAEPIDHSFGTGKETVAAVCRQASYFDQYAAVPKELTTNTALAPHQNFVLTDRATIGCPVHHYRKNPILSVLTAMFLHGGWLHLLGNMLFLFVFGNNVEDRLGRLKFLAFYLFCGYVAAYGFALSTPDSTQPLIGASGAIAGVLGAYIVLFPRARVTSVVPFLLFLPLRLPAWLVLGFWFLLQWAYSAGGALASGADVAYLAHVAGFLAGAILVFIFRLRARNPDPPRYAG